MPKVSVIIPNYNHGRYLAQRLESVFAQTFQDFEALFLDDCSTDDSLSVVKNFADDARIRIIVNEQNSGSPFKQWNKGLEQANGEYIWIAESDDYADPEFLAVLTAVMDIHPDVGLAYSQSLFANSDPGDNQATGLDHWYASFPDSNRWHSNFLNDGANELAGYLAFKNTIPNASAVLIRKSVLREGLRAPEDMRLAGDWMFWAKVLAKSNVYFVAKPLNFFRKPHPGSQRKKVLKQGLELLEGLDIYSYIATNVGLDQAAKSRALSHQVKLWGFLASARPLAWNTNRTIFRKLLEVHPEVEGQVTRRVRLPFVWYFLAMSLKRVPFADSTYKWIRGRLQGASMSPSHHAGKGDK